MNVVDKKRPLRRRVKRLLLFSGLALLLIASAITIFAVWTRSGPGPRIGVSVSGDWYDRLQFHRAAYDLAVKRAGGRVVTLEAQDPANVESLLDGVDGLLLVGGGDVDPGLFGGDLPDPRLVDRQRDEFEIALLKRADARGLPVLAICRGIQILAVAEGGRLRDLSAEPMLAARHGISLRSFEAHDVSINSGTRLHALLGDGPHRVNSFHRQAVQNPGPRLRVAAVDPDGVIEAVELPGPRMVIGMQWHPELHSATRAVSYTAEDDPHMAVFRMLIAEARKHRKR